MDRKMGEKAERWLNPYRKENWTRKRAVRFDRTADVRRRERWGSQNIGLE
jgi:hypothetical protein